MSGVLFALKVDKWWTDVYVVSECVYIAIKIAVELHPLQERFEFIYSHFV